MNSFSPAGASIEPKEFENFYNSLLGSISEETNDLPKFVDTESYYFYSMFVVRNQTIPYGMQADVEFYERNQKKYPEAYVCSQKIVEHIEQHYNCKLSADEKMYLIIYVKRLILEMGHQS